MRVFRAAVAAVFCVLGVAQISAPSVSAQDRAAPGRPTAVAAQPLHNELFVTWKPPTSTGGRAIQSYRISVNGQVLGSVAGRARSVTITGLRNGVSYRVGVAARNADGVGAGAFVSATPRPVPGPPTLAPLTSTFVDITASWSATAGTRPTPTSDFRIQVSTDNGATWTAATPSVRNGRDAVFRDMTPGRRYVYRVAGRNAAGWGAWSNTRAITIATSKATAVAAGQGHYCALVEDTSVRCWGENARGQLGNGTTTQSRTPVLVRNADGSALTGVTQVTASAFNTCVLLQSTEVRCGGDNNFSSRVSDDDVGAAITSPVTITDTGVSTGTPLTGVLQVDVGFSNTCVLLTGGAVRAGASTSRENSVTVPTTQLVASRSRWSPRAVRSRMSRRSPSAATRAVPW